MSLKWFNPSSQTKNKSITGEGSNLYSNFKFRYEAKIHRELPHIIKFSGGRSSGMMLFLLLENGFLKAERGDVIIFNNTSAEHPKTYEFTKRCKEQVESKYKVPFFWIEFQTYEDVRNGEWTRLPTYRLVKPEPYSNQLPDGYHCQGEVYEEMLSWSGFVPNIFQRTCTTNLKLETTRAFLKDWFACKVSTEHLGHFGNCSRIDNDEIFNRHKRCNGGVPKDIFLKKKKFVLSRPVFRSGQKFFDFSRSFKPLNNPHLKGKSYGNKANLEDGVIEYLAFIGLRFDEKRRVLKVRARNSNSSKKDGYNGEHVYIPLDDMGITQKNVSEFWDRRDWTLELDDKDELSNCAYCFLKGVKKLKTVFKSLEEKQQPEWKGTPCDINWWINIEKKYGRDLTAEKRKVRTKGHNNFIGFFGMESGFTYEDLTKLARGDNSLAQYETSILPCDCTD